MGIKSRLKNFFALEDEMVDEEGYDIEYENEDEVQTPSRFHRDQKSQNIVSLQSVQKQVKVVLIEPRQYSEAQEIADQLTNRRAVVMNLQRIPLDQATRIVDFLSGTVYAIGGDIQKLGPNTFLCTPDNVDVSGMISEIDDEE